MTGPSSNLGAQKAGESRAARWSSSGSACPRGCSFWERKSKSWTFWIVFGPYQASSTKKCAFGAQGFCNMVNASPQAGRRALAFHAALELRFNRSSVSSVELTSPSTTRV